MNYTHDGATWSTNLTTGETVKIAGRRDDDVYQGCTGRVIGLMDGRVILLLPGDRVRSFSPHELARPNGTPHVTLISGKPRAAKKPTKRQPTNFRGQPLKGAA